MFDDRNDAGRRLAVLLDHHRGPDVVALGLPRGGVPVALEVARALHLPLDVVVTRRLGLPYGHGAAMGVLGEGGVGVLDAELVRRARIGRLELAGVERRTSALVCAHADRWREGRPPVPLTGRTALVVDDGVASGATMRAAVAVARARGAVQVVVATPVAPTWLTAAMLGADELVCVEQSRDHRAVGDFYRDFTPVSDDDVHDLLAQWALTELADARVRGARRRR